MQVDFIIVGQGLAGSCFALELLKQKKTFIIIDEYNSNTSSRIALGVYNPIILKWLTKPWEIDNQMKQFDIFYNRINSFLNINCLDDIGLYKYLNSIYDQNNWLLKSKSSVRKSYMSPTLHSIKNKGLINNDNYGLVKNAGRVNIQLFLASFRDYCRRHNKIIEEKLNYNDLVVNSSSFFFRNFTARKVIFCQGYFGLENPYFSNLNFSPTKGEILHIYCKGLNLKKLLHFGLLLVPLGGDVYSVGATYDRNFINNDLTIESKNKIIDILDRALNKPYRVIKHLAAIRPSTVDRKPLIGAHKDYKNIYIINGLGSRGVLLAPYLSHLLIQSIYYNKTIPVEINVNRF